MHLAFAALLITLDDPKSLRLSNVCRRVFQGRVKQFLGINEFSLEIISIKIRLYEIIPVQKIALPSKDRELEAPPSPTSTLDMRNF